MLQPEEIDKLIKTAYGSKTPYWKQSYFRSICRNLQVHTKGELFSKVDTVYPNESPESKQHSIDTYEPITQGSIKKAINNIIRIFSNSSFSISASDTTLEFISQPEFCDENLFSFFVSEWTAQTISTDPNSLIAVYPPEYVLEDQEMIRYVKSEHTLKIDKDIVAFISESESEKEYHVVETAIDRQVFYDDNINTLNCRSIVNKTYNKRLEVKFIKKVFHVFTKEAFIRFTTEDEIVFDYEVYNFKKPLELIPAFKVSAVNLQPGVNESFVSSFIPFGNLALLQHRNHRAVDLMFSYPRMSEIQVPCDNVDCIDGQCRSNENVFKNCNRCAGRGWITPQSPYKVYQKRVDTNLTDPELAKQVLAASPVEFFTPPVGVLAYSKDSWKDYLRMAEEAVFIQQKQVTGHVESAKSKDIDKEAEYSWILNISKALNNDMSKAVQAIESYLNANPVIVSIEQPISFAIVTETEAFQNLDIIMSSEAPIMVKSQQVESFINKFVSKSSPIVKSINVLKLIDPLMFYSNADIQIFKSNNSINVDQWTTHIYAYPVLMKLYEQDKLLFEKNDEEIGVLILAEIDKFKPGKIVDLKNSISAKINTKGAVA